MAIKITKEDKENHPELEEMISNLKEIDSIEVVSLTNGGKLLSQSLVKDVVGLVDTLCAKYLTMTQAEFIGICAEMKSKIDLVRVMKRAPKNKKDLEDIIADTLSQ